MSRYFTKAAVVCTPSPQDADRQLDDFFPVPSMMVHEDELETFTGLYDARGFEIHRTERIAMGFHRDDD